MTVSILAFKSLKRSVDRLVKAEAAYATRHQPPNSSPELAADELAKARAAYNRSLDKLKGTP